MLSDRPLLTIAIPTYNRGDYLAQLLEWLKPQLDDKGLVELLVSDNASSDHTSSVLDDFRSRGMRFRYIRNQVNIGADANFLQCFHCGRGKYFWLVGDDDIVLGGAIAKLVSLLAAEDYALVYLSPFPFRRDVLGEKDRDKLGRFAQRFPNGVEFIRKAGTTIAFISSMIVNKERFRSVPHPRLEGLDGSNLMHLGWVLPLLCSGGDSLIVWDRLVGARSGNSGGWGICRVFSDSLTKVIEMTIQDQNGIGSEIVNCTLRNWFPLMISEMRRGTAGALCEEDIRRCLERHHRKNWRYWFYIFPVVYLPRVTALAWYEITRTLNRIARFVVLVSTYPLWRRNLIREP